MPFADVRRRSRRDRASRGLWLLLLLLVAIGGAGAALTRLAPRPPPVPAPADAAPYDLRLSGSALLGDALAPALVEAWLTSRGADEVDIAQLRAGATLLPERVVSARLGERKTRVDVRAGGADRGLADLAAGRADIALVARSAGSPRPASGVDAAVEIGETRATPAAPAVQRLLVYTPAAPSPAARAFIAFATGDAGQAIVRSAGLLATADAARPSAPH